MLTLQHAYAAADVPPRRKLRAWAQAALERDARVTLRFVGARESRALNRRFRGRDHATNVLSFVYDQRPHTSGDIAICAPVVAREARAGGIPLESHYAHMLVHGLLHLQGYDHLRARDARLMEDREVEILRSLGFADPYRGAER